MEAKATFGAGCFWGVEAAFRRIEGVTATAVGYAGGRTEEPSYEQVCAEATGHAEVVEVVYDRDRIASSSCSRSSGPSTTPTRLNRRGASLGAQYRSVIFVHDPEQRAAAEASRERAGAAVAPGRDGDRGRAGLLGGRGAPPALPREARPHELQRLARALRAQGAPAPGEAARRLAGRFPGASG